MFSIKRLDTIRKMKCEMIKTAMCLKKLSRDDFKPIHPAFFVRFNKESGQFEIDKEDKP
jgi:hypothetical protein